MNELKKNHLLRHCSNKQLNFPFQNMFKKNNKNKSIDKKYDDIAV